MGNQNKDVIDHVGAMKEFKELGFEVVGGNSNGKFEFRGSEPTEDQVRSVVAKHVISEVEAKPGPVAQDFIWAVPISLTTDIYKSLTKNQKKFVDDQVVAMAKRGLEGLQNMGIK